MTSPPHRAEGVLGWNRADHISILILSIVLLIPYIYLSGFIWHTKFVVQDDARHFVVWLRRLHDPQLFANDVIADHFIALTPWLYRALYIPFITLGFDPIVIHLYVFMPLTAVLLGLAAYLFVRLYWHEPAGAAVAAAFLVYFVGFPLGLAHDFGYTTALALLFAFCSRRIVWCGGLMLAGTGLLPVAGAISGLTMGLLMLRRPPLYLIHDRRAWLTLITAAAAGALGVLSVLSSAVELGSTFSLEEARSLPVFNPGGRRPYWGQTFFSTYICSDNTGIVPFCEVTGQAWVAAAWTVSSVVALCGGVLLMRRGYVNRLLDFIGLPLMSGKLADVCVAWLVAGTSMFVIAHLVAFRLHMPERFSRYSIALTFALIVSLAVAITALAIVRFVLERLGKRPAFVIAYLAGTIFIWTAGNALVARSNLTFSDAPKIETFLATTPKDSLVAGVGLEIDSVPAFGERSVLTSSQLFVPYMKAFYLELENRTVSMIDALYGTDIDRFRRFMKKYGVDYVMVATTTDRELAFLREWAINFPAAWPTVHAVERGRAPFFQMSIDRCSPVRDGGLVLLDAHCLATNP